MKKVFGKFTELVSRVDFPFEILKTEGEMEAATELLGREECIAFDIETTGLDPNADDARVLSISFAASEFLGGIVFNDAKDDSTVDPKLAMKYIEIILGNSVPKIAHNATYDCNYIRATNGIITQNCVYDTLLGFYLLNEKPRKRGLKVLGREFTNLGVIDFPEGVDLSTYPGKELLRYNCSDTRLTLTLFEHIKPLIYDLKMDGLWRLVTKASIVFGGITLNGVKLDMPRLEEVQRNFQEKELESKTELLQIAKDEEFPDINLNSPLSVRDFLFNTLNLPVTIRTNGGSPSTAVDAIKDLDHPFPRKLVEYRKLGKTLKYFENLDSHIDDDDRIHPQYKLWNTATGRTSCSEPNIQNIPREGGVRDLFITKPGWWLVEADYSQAELRTMALYSGDKNLKKAFLSGRDVHKEVASFLYNKPLDDITKEERRRAKTMNFALLYGMGPKSLGEDLGISTEEATSLIAQYFQQFPGVDKWISKQHAIAQSKGFVESKLHRFRRFPEILDRNVPQGLRAEILKWSVNTIIQGTASDFALMGLLAVHKALGSMEANMVLFVHDSIMVECPKAEVKNVVKILRKGMVTFSKKLPIPFVVDIKVGQNWGELIELSPPKKKK